MRQSIVLRDAVARANKVIYQTSQSRTDCEGMGTTVVAALFYDNKVSVAHVGDSRVYRLRNEELSSRSRWTIRCCRNWFRAASTPRKKLSAP